MAVLIRRFYIRYMWLNLEIDIIDIGGTCLEDLTPIAPMIQRLKFTRKHSEEYFYHAEIRELEHFTNVREIHIVCEDGLYAWLGALEEHYWPCGEENVFFIDPADEERVFRGNEGLDRIADLEEEEYGPWL